MRDKMLFGLFLFSLCFGCFLCQSSYCPSSASLAPYCNCSATSSSRIVMDCSSVETEDQLNTIFTTSSILYTRMYELIIENNKDLQYISNNVFGSVSFQIITFRNDTIRYIDEMVFVNSRSYLQEWYIYSCHSIASGFPYWSLNSYTFLATLHFEGMGYIEVMPRIHSSSLKYFSFLKTEISFFPSTSFLDIPNLQEIYLHGNNITIFPPGIFEANPDLIVISILENNMELISAGTFVDLTLLESLYLNMSKMSLIEPGALRNLPKLVNVSFAVNDLSYLTSGMLGYLPSAKNISIERNSIQVYEKYLFNCCPNLESFDADNNRLAKVTKYDFRGSTALSELSFDKNEISYIEPDSFTDLKDGFLQLNSNKLTTLDEGWLRSVLDKNNVVSITGNPLSCGCDLAWLFEEPLLMINLSATCSNGTDIHNLDPSYFIDNCFFGNSSYLSY